MLPEKRHPNGVMKTGSETSNELQSYVRALLAIPKVMRMIAFRHFFIINEQIENKVDLKLS